MTDNDTMLLAYAEEEGCELQLWDMMTQTIKKSQWYSLVQEIDHYTHRPSFAIIFNKHGYQLVLGLYGELTVIDLETLEKLKILDEGTSTEIMDIASTPCG